MTNQQIPAFSIEPPKPNASRKGVGDGEIHIHLRDR